MSNGCAQRLSVTYNKPLYKTRRITNEHLDCYYTLKYHLGRGVPEKWILFDSETGQKYIGTNNIEIGKNWKLIEEDE